MNLRVTLCSSHNALHFSSIITLYYSAILWRLPTLPGAHNVSDVSELVGVGGAVGGGVCGVTWNIAYDRILMNPWSIFLHEEIGLSLEKVCHELLLKDYYYR